VVSKSDFESDCARCQALCCIAPTFEKSETFAYSKPAGEVCKHLMTNNRCAIHEELAEHGFSGCGAYECFGAGQKVVQAHFPNQSWRNDPALAREVFDTYFTIKALHELLVYLVEGIEYCDGAELQTDFNSLIDEIEARTQPGARLPDADEIEAYRQAVSKLLSVAREQRIDPELA